MFGTDQGDQDVEQVPHVAQRWHEDVAVAVRLLRVREELLVVLQEVAFGGLLVVEDLDDLLPVHHLLDEALLGGQGRLLADHVPCRGPAQSPRERHHDPGDHNDQGGEPHRVAEHCDGDDGDGEGRLDEGGDRLADELADRVRVVRVSRHDRAVRVRVEEAQRQRLHAVEHVVAHVLERPLGDDRHDPRVEEGREHARGEDRPHREDEAHEGLPHGIDALGHARGDDRVDDLLQEDRADRRGDRRHDDADRHDDEADPVEAEEVCGESAEGALDALELLRVRVGARHVTPPRFPWSGSGIRRSRGTPRPPP